MSSVKENISRSSSWLRGLFMLIFVAIYSVAELVLGVVVIFQFLFLVFSGEPNARLQRFGRQLSAFIYEIFLYLTFNSETRPFPFDNWPDIDEANRVAEAAGRPSGQARPEAEPAVVEAEVLVEKPETREPPPEK